MFFFSTNSPSFLILTLLFTALLPPTIPSHLNNLLQLPSQSHPQHNDLCPFNPLPDNCPVKCFRPDPVCGVDGVIYWCGCADAHCAGARVKNFGFCQVGNGDSGTAGQALLLVHIIWLVLLGVCVLFGLL